MLHCTALYCTALHAQVDHLCSVYQSLPMERSGNEPESKQFGDAWRVLKVGRGGAFLEMLSVMGKTYEALTGGEGRGAHVWMGERLAEVPFYVVPLKSL